MNENDYAQDLATIVKDSSSVMTAYQIENLVWNLVQKLNNLPWVDRIESKSNPRMTCLDVHKTIRVYSVVTV